MHLTSRMTGLALTLGLSILAANALASDIYRYTDEDGNVHFTDRPPGETPAERVAIASKPTDDEAVRQRYEAQFGGDRKSDPEDEQAADDEEEEKPKTRNDYLVEAEQRARDCSRYRVQLENIEASRRVYREDTSTGERTYLDDVQVEEARARMRQLVADTCD